MQDFGCHFYIFFRRIFLVNNECKPYFDLKPVSNSGDYGKSFTVIGFISDDESSNSGSSCHSCGFQYYDNLCTTTD